MDRKSFLKNLGIDLFTSDVEFRLKRDLNFLIGQMLIEARLFKGLTQTELAKKVGTTQSSIARYERGGTLASLQFLSKVAKSLGTYLIPPKFGFFTEIEKSKTESQLSSTSFKDLKFDHLEKSSISNISYSSQHHPQPVTL